MNAIYGHNNNTLAKHLFTKMFKQPIVELKKLKEKYKTAHLIIRGDLNNAADDQMDRLPARITLNSRFKAVSHLSEQLNIVDVWQYLHPYHNEYTWSNDDGSLRSRTDLSLLSTPTVQFVSEASHSYAPFSDHKMILMTFVDPFEKGKKTHGYWKLNCSLLEDKTFCKSVEVNVKDIFSCNDVSGIQQWEFFKFKMRELSIDHCKEM